MCGYDTTNSLRGQGLEFVKVAVCAILLQQKPLPAAVLAAERGFSFCVLWRAAGRTSCPGGGRQQGSTGAAPQHVPKQCGGRPRTSPRIGTLSFVTQNLLWCDQQQECAFLFVATSDGHFVCRVYRRSLITCRLLIPWQLHRSRHIHLEFGEPLDASGNGREAHRQILDFIAERTAHWNLAERRAPCASAGLNGFRPAPVS